MVLGQTGCDMRPCNDPRVDHRPKQGKHVTEATIARAIDLIEQRLMEAQILRQEILSDLQAWHRKRRPTKGGASQQMLSPR